MENPEYQASREYHRMPGKEKHSPVEPGRKASKKLPNQDNVLLDFLEEKENIWHFSMNNEINIKAEFSLSEIKRIP